VSRIEQSGRMSLRRPKTPIKGGSEPEEEEEEEEEEEVVVVVVVVVAAAAAGLNTPTMALRVVTAETRFCLSAKQPSPFKLAGVLVQSTTGT